jgi:hypothetical protein
VFAGTVLLRESSHRQSTLFLFRDQFTPELASFFLSPRHAASIRDPSPLAKWCSCDGYG